MAVVRGFLGINKNWKKESSCKKYTAPYPGLCILQSSLSCKAGKVKEFYYFDFFLGSRAIEESTFILKWAIKNQRKYDGE
ncbi:hypothetical protein PEDI_43770 [Persicobacter diffluens]|uniref:Uncharacterized protein n=1 Tax=Persicobacter diffluens TaxID=981 RepID=A0AAN4W3E9_9BACT|nr:hypothetical protein PEDI_43770 [Persicobacter diffluens]